MKNLIIDTQKIKDMPIQEPWEISSADNEYKLNVNWSFNQPSLIYTTPAGQTTIMMYGYTLYPDFMIPDEWVAFNVGGGVPDNLFTVLYSIKEIIELIGQWKDLNREATSLIDAINQSAIAADIQSSLDKADTALQDIPNGSITTAKIVDGAVTNAKIADGAINSAKIVNLSVTNEKLGNLSVYAGKIADNQITTAKIVDGAVTNAKLGTAAVITDRIADLAVSSVKL
jgi:hypothetical protein